MSNEQVNIEVGSVWTHHSNGKQYRVMNIANIGHHDERYPVTIVYHGKNGNVWAKEINRFHETMKSTGLKVTEDEWLSYIPILFDKQTAERWEKFRKAGLLQFVNAILHVFGYALYIVLNENNNVQSAYPARCSFRGFDEKSNTEMYYRLGKYIEENGQSIVNEGFDSEEQKYFEERRK